MAEHRDQAVDAETADLASDKIADSWLRDAQEAGGLSLGQALRLDELCELNHEIGADLQMLRLFDGETQVLEYIAAERRVRVAIELTFLGSPSTRLKLRVAMLGQL